MEMILVGIVAGIIGSILGLGGGLVVTPFLTVFMGMPIHVAIGASLIAVLATSAGSASQFLKTDLVNLRVATFLEVFTTAGAVIGAVLASWFQAQWLYFLFGGLLIFQAWHMWWKLMGQRQETAPIAPDDPRSRLGVTLGLQGTYQATTDGAPVPYVLQRIPLGSAVMFGAGLASGLLGIGSGAFKVMGMDGVMQMPLKVSTATSNLMMGVTAVASAVIYFVTGQIDPLVAAPIAVGVLLGARLGAKLVPKLPVKAVRLLFIPVVLVMAGQLIYKGMLGG